MQSFRILSLLLLTICKSTSLFAQSQDSLSAFIKYSKPSFAITNVTVIDGTGASPQQNMTVVVKNGIITFAGPSDQVSVTKESTVIDGSGKTLIPGFVMVHEHMFYAKSFEDQFNIMNMTNTFPRMYLAGGATTIRTGGSVEPYTDLNIKKLILSGKMIGPKMDVTGPFIERENDFGIPQMPILPAGQSAGEMVDYWANLGCTSFKVYMNISNFDLSEVLEHAHVRGLKVTGHLCSITYREAANAGIDNLEHGFMACNDFNTFHKKDECEYTHTWQSLLALDKDAPQMDSLMNLLIQKQVTLTTTLPVFAPIKNYELIPGGGEFALHPDILARITQESKQNPVIDSIDQLLFEKELYWINKFYHMGGKLVAGTDPTGAGRTLPGYANMWTLETLIKSGFTPSEAVNICTLNGAEYLRKKFDTGSIQKGKAADLILMDGNLATDPSSIRKIRFVFKDGIGYDSALLFQSVKGKAGLY